MIPQTWQSDGKELDDALIQISASKGVKSKMADNWWIDRQNKLREKNQEEKLRYTVSAI